MMIADLHIHSKYSRATSRDCDLEHLELWARRKGIGVLGTGDFTHPAWREEMRQKLVPAEEGLYTLKEEYRLPAQVAGEGEAPRFLVTGEISSIYKKRDRVRKVHSLILLPGLEAAEELSQMCIRDSHEREPMENSLRTDIQNMEDEGSCANFVDKRRSFRYNLHSMK